MVCLTSSRSRSGSASSCLRTAGRPGMVGSAIGCLISLFDVCQDSKRMTPVADVAAPAMLCARLRLALRTTGATQSLNALVHHDRGRYSQEGKTYKFRYLGAS